MGKWSGSKSQLSPPVPAATRTSGTARPQNATWEEPKGLQKTPHESTRPQKLRRSAPKYEPTPNKSPRGQGWGRPRRFGFSSKRGSAPILLLGEPEFRVAPRSRGVFGAERGPHLPRSPSSAPKKARRGSQNLVPTRGEPSPVAGGWQIAARKRANRSFLLRAAKTTKTGGSHQKKMGFWGRRRVRGGGSPVWGQAGGSRDLLWHGLSPGKQKVSPVG